MAVQPPQFASLYRQSLGSVVHRQTIDVIDPSDGKAFAKIARGNAAALTLAVLAARSALGEIL